MKEVWDFNGIGNVYALELLFPIVLYQKKEKVKKQTQNHFKTYKEKVKNNSKSNETTNFHIIDRQKIHTHTINHQNAFCETFKVAFLTKITELYSTKIDYFIDEHKKINKAH
jgi:hypothetical protein